MKTLKKTQVEEYALNLRKEATFFRMDEIKWHKQIDDRKRTFRQRKNSVNNGMEA